MNPLTPFLSKPSNAKLNPNLGTGFSLTGGKLQLKPNQPAPQPVQQPSNSVQPTAPVAPVRTTQAPVTPTSTNVQSDLENTIRQQLGGFTGELTKDTVNDLRTPTTPITPTAQSQPVTPATVRVNGQTPLEAAYTKTFTASPEEQKAQQELDRFREEYKKNINATGQQTIGTEFITGQQQSMFENAQLGEETLETRLARMQTERLAQQQGAKFNLERADTAQATLAEQQKAQQDAINQIGTSALTQGATQEQLGNIFGAGTQQGALQQAAGTGLFAPEEASPETSFQTINGQVTLVNNATGETIRTLGASEGAMKRASDASIAGGVSGVQGANVSPLTQSIIDGIGTLDDLTPSDRAVVLRELSNAGVQTGSAVKKANAIRNVVEELKNSEGLAGVTGFFEGGLPAKTSKQIQAIAKFEQLKGLLTLENMSLMSGVLSDSDIKILQNASTSLSRRLSGSDFNKELDKIIGALKVSETGGVISPTAQQAQPTSGQTSSGLSYTIIQ